MTGVAEGLGIKPAVNGVCPITTDILCEIFINFVTLISGRALYKYQRTTAYRIFESVLENNGDVITSLFSRQSGKSEVTAGVCATLMIMLPLLARMFPNDTRFVLRDLKTDVVVGYATGFRVGCFGPKKEQADIIYNRIRGFFDRAETQQLMAAFELEFNVSNGKTCALTNGSLCTAHTANEGASIEGPSYHLIITDETQKIADQMIRKSIIPMGSSTNATMVHLGTATIGKCYFYYAIRQNMRAYAVGGRRCHFQVNYKEAMAENSFYAKYIQTQIKRLGETSDEFMMSYENKWLLERGQFVDEVMLEKCQDKLRGPGDYKTQGRIPRSATMSLVVGMDFGKQHDRTVVSIGLVDFRNPVFEDEVTTEQEWKIIQLFACELIEWFTFDGDDYEWQFEQITMRLKAVQMITNYRLRRIALDATGCGAAISDRFKATFPNTEIMDVVFSLQTKDALYRSFMRAIRQPGHFTYPALPEVVAENRDFELFNQEMCDLEKTFNNGLMVVKHPDEAGAHDDYPDSAALLCWTAASPLMFDDIEQYDNNIFNRRRNGHR